VRFHDLRHTTATLLLKEGVSLAVVSKLLRHSDPAITLGTYGHLDIEDLRDAVDRLPFRPANGSATGHAASGPGQQLGAPVARNSRSAKKEGRDASGNPNNIAALRWSGRLDLNQRPLAPQAGLYVESMVTGVPNYDASSHLSSVAVARACMVTSQPSRCVAPDPSGFAARLLPASRTKAQALEATIAVRADGRGDLLTVRAVAARLGVCRATVYDR
jgi:integrase-like protein